MKKIYKDSIIGVIFAIVIPIAVFITIMLVGILGGGKTEKREPTDAHMIEHFNRNENDFKELRSMIEEDSLRFYPLSYLDKKAGDSLLISKNRQQEYDSIMKKLQIESFYHPEWYHDRSDKTILFLFWSIGDATWGIDKGFEYVPDRNNEEGKEFTDEELYDLAMKKYKNCDLYKKINDNWNLFLFYDR